MAKKGKIVSFEDARRSSRSANRDEWAMYASTPAKKTKAGSAPRSSTTRGSRPSRSVSYEEPPRRPARSKARPAEQRRVSDEHAKKTTRTRASAAEAREPKKRTKAQGRTNRQPDRAYAERSDASRQTKGSSRSATYRGEKGKPRRKSTIMQRASEAGSVAAKINPAGWLSHINLSSRTAKLVTIAICAVFVCAFLYTPAQQYYQAVRDNARLEAEYAAVASRNAALDAHNDSLASDAGMEDAVRQKFGYIVAGEQTAVVSGLSDEVDASKRANAEVEANVLASSIKAPEEWYTPILDALFGVE